MCDTKAAAKTLLGPGKTVEVVAGQYHKFMLLPIMDDESVWFEAGPILFGIEGRAFGVDDKVLERGCTIHVYDAETKDEWLRFDCFDDHPHYHYIHSAEQHNTVWGYDRVANGEMLPWAIETLRRRMVPMLRKAGAAKLADRVEKEGFDTSVLDKVERAMVEAHKRTFPGVDMIPASTEWYMRWKKLHPEFNTVDY